VIFSFAVGAVLAETPKLIAIIAITNMAFKKYFIITFFFEHQRFSIFFIDTRSEKNIFHYYL
jgi:hypothetical protein